MVGAGYAAAGSSSSDAKVSGTTQTATPHQRQLAQRLGLVMPGGKLDAPWVLTWMSPDLHMGEIEVPLYTDGLFFSEFQFGAAAESVGDGAGVGGPPLRLGDDHDQLILIPAKLPILKFSTS